MANRSIERWAWISMLILPSALAPRAHAEVTSSGSRPGMPATGASDGDRFSAGEGHAWSGVPGQSSWWIQFSFPEPRPIGAILRIVGDHEFVSRNAPKESVWEVSLDGEAWKRLPETWHADDRRIYRIDRLDRVEWCRMARLCINRAHGDAPVVREIEFYSDPADNIPFPPWMIAVNVTHDPALPGAGNEFIPLARSCDGWASLRAQQVWLTDFCHSFVDVEPRPLCAMLSGSYWDWCQVDRGHWRGVEDVLLSGRLPMWASCGGAQGLALIAEYGVDRPWDCPHCRDPRDPKTPLYSHIGHRGGPLVCGQYDHCIFERGPTRVRKVGEDPVFANLPGEFTVMESHCGQIERAPRGWSLVAEGAAHTLTRTQCLRRDGGCVYAAQFHVEMAGTPETSRVIVGNFLRLADRYLSDSTRPPD